MELTKHHNTNAENRGNNFEKSGDSCFAGLPVSRLSNPRRSAFRGAEPKVTLITPPEQVDQTGKENIKGWRGTPKQTHLRQAECFWMI